MNYIQDTKSNLFRNFVNGEYLFNETVASCKDDFSPDSILDTRDSRFLIRVNNSKTIVS